MDSDILNQTRSAYFLGNYGKVLEIWQNYDETPYNDIDYYYFIVSRALLAQRELKPKQSFQFSKKPTQKLLEVTDIVSKFMAPLLKVGKASTDISDDRRIIEEALKKIKETFNEQNQYYKMMQIICSYLSINSCELQYSLQIESSKVKEHFAKWIIAEIFFLQLIALLRGNRKDLAEKKLQELKQFDDEDILTYLGQIYTNFYGGQTDQAILFINETKERFGDSAKLMNLMVNCLISEFKFEEALNLAQKLQFALFEKEQFSDRNEIEICLSNLILLGQVTGKSQIKEECQQALQTINQGSYFLKYQNEQLKKLNECIDQ